MSSTLDQPTAASEHRPTLRCPSCRARFRVGGAAQVGDRVRCPQCQHKIRLGLEVLQGRVIAGYRLRKRLGSGAMGTVFVAEKDGQEVAIKLLSPAAAHDQELRARFEREGRLCHRLQHPGLIKVFASGEYDGTPYLLMEYVHGACLDTIIEKAKTMNWRKASAVIRQMVDVLIYLQQQGVVHRDIKPENILLDRQQRVRLIDLGFAKGLHEAADERADTNQLTMQGSALGSPAYMAPEQILDAQTVTHATDCYGLGATFYHMVTGQLPFDGPSAMVVMEAVLAGKPRPVTALRPQLPRNLDRVIAWMMQPDPRHRPRDFNALAAILDQLRQDPQRVSGLPQQPLSKKLLMMVIILISITVAALFLALWWNK